MACSGLSLTSGPSWTSLPPLEPIVPDLQGEGGLPPPPPQVRQALFPGPYTPPHSQAISRLRRFSVSSWVMDINCSILILGTKKLINLSIYSADVTLLTGNPIRAAPPSRGSPPGCAHPDKLPPHPAAPRLAAALHQHLSIPFGKRAKDRNGHFTDA